MKLLLKRFQMILLALLLLISSVDSLTGVHAEEMDDGKETASETENWEETILFDTKEDWLDYVYNIDWTYAPSAILTEETQRYEEIMETAASLAEDEAAAYFDDLSESDQALIEKVSSSMIDTADTLYRSRRICQHYLGDGSGQLSYISEMYMNGVLAYCLEPYALIVFDSGGYLDGYWGGNAWSYAELSSYQKEEIALAMYYGYGYNGDYADQMFVATQLKIWAICGYPNEGASIDYSDAMQVLEWRMAANPKAIAPSFDGQTVSLTPGKTVILQDSNNVLDRFSITSAAGISLSASGNKLSVTLNDPFQFSSSVSYGAGGENLLDTCVIYQSKNSQTVMSKPMSDPAVSWNLYFKLDTVPITIRKQDIETGTTAQGEAMLAGAQFRITDNQGWGYDMLLTADENGVASISTLPAGSYTITEIKAPTGYLIDKDSVLTIDTSGETKKEIIIKDQVIKNKITIIKEDAETQKSIAGSVFEIYDCRGAKVDTVTIQADGSGTSGPLPYGHYTVKEVKAMPKGYMLNESVFSVFINDVQEAYTIDVQNIPQKGKVTITKIDAETGSSAQGEASLNGAVYNLVAAEDIVGGDGTLWFRAKEVAEQLKTDSDSTVISSSELPLGKYQIVEIVAPKGYTLSEPIEVEFTAQPQSIRLDDKHIDLADKVIQGKISVTKYLDDGQLGSGIRKPAEGVVFEVYAKKDNALAAVLTTDENGYAVTDWLPYGTYVVKEAKGKEGYETADDFEIFISQDGKTYGNIIANEIVNAELTVYKIDAETGKIVPAAGVTFKLLDAGGNFVEQTVTYPVKYTTTEFMTDETGSVHFPQVLTYGTYTMVEIQAPYGYALSTEEIALTVDGSAKEIFLSYPDKAQKGIVRIYKYGELLSGYTTEETVYGTLYTPVFKKGYLDGVRYEITARKDIVGAEGTLWYSAGEIVDIIVTNSAGPSESKELPLGAYTIRETAAKEGYVNDGVSYDFDVLYQGQEIDLFYIDQSYENQRQKAIVSFHKEMEDSPFQDSAAAAKNVVFGLFSAEEITSNGIVLPKDSLLGITALDEELNGSFKEQLAGSYYIRELQTDEGYLLNEDAFFTAFAYSPFNTEWTEYRIQPAIENRVKRGSLRVIKTDEFGEAVSGASFEISKDKDFSEILYTGITDEQGILNIEEIPVSLQSCYYLRETGTSVGYELNLDILDFQIEWNQTTEVEFTNYFKSVELKVTKQDDFGNPINGAVFDLYRLAEETDQDITQAYLLPVGNTVDLALYLDSGEISIDEEKAHASLNGTKLTMKEVSCFEATDGKETLLMIGTTTQQEGLLSLVKILTSVTGVPTVRAVDSRYQKRPIEGYEVKIYTDPEKDEPIFTDLTDADGVVRLDLADGTYYWNDPNKKELQKIKIDNHFDGTASFSGLYWGQQYYVVESGLTEGYDYVEEVLFKVDTETDGGLSTELKVVNKKRRIDIKVTKTNQENQNEKLNGAYFEAEDLTANEKLGTYVSGAIFIQAEIAGLHYEISDTKDFSTILAEKIADSQGEIMFFEIDGEPLEGIYYYRIKGAEEVIEVSVSPGVLTIEDCLYDHKIKITETKAPQGYSADASSEIIEVKAAYNQNIIELLKTNKKVIKKLITYKMGAE